MQAIASQKGLSKLRGLANVRRLAGVWQKGWFALRTAWMKIGHRGRVAGVAVVTTAILTALLVLMVGVSGGSKWQSAEIADVTRTSTLTLTPDPRLKNVDQLILRIRGNIDGTAQMAGAPLRAQRVSGRFEITHDENHPGPSCVINYMPVGVSKGHVRVEYQFRERQQ